MTSLFYEGGLFMGILTILLLIILAMGVYRFIQISKNNYEHATTFRHHLSRINLWDYLHWWLEFLVNCLGSIRYFLLSARRDQYHPQF